MWPGGRGCRSDLVTTRGPAFASGCPPWPRLRWCCWSPRGSDEGRAGGRGAGPAPLASGSVVVSEESPATRTTAVRDADRSVVRVHVAERAGQLLFSLL